MNKTVKLICYDNYQRYDHFWSVQERELDYQKRLLSMKQSIVWTVSVLLHPPHEEPNSNKFILGQMSFSLKELSNRYFSPHGVAFFSQEFLCNVHRFNLFRFGTFSPDPNKQTRSSCVQNETILQNRMQWKY